MKMTVLIADKFPDKYIQQLTDSGLEVIYEPKTGENELAEKAKFVDILIVRSTIVNETTILSSQNLNLIVRAGKNPCDCRFWKYW
jgi:phosphoglycerate dehydrogenase-like enzyme